MKKKHRFFKGHKTLILSFVAANIIIGLVRADDEQMADRLNHLISQYAAIPAVHMRASISWDFNDKVLFEKPEQVENRRTTSSYEFWATDGLYRICHLCDQRIAPGMNYELAYNGQKIQLYDLTNRYLSISSTEDKSIAVLPPNPFFCPLLFLSGEDPSQTIKLSDVISPAKKNLILAAKRIQPIGSKEFVLELPGGVLDEETSFVFHVYFNQDPNWLPRRIDRISLDGKVLTTLIVEYGEQSWKEKKLYLPKLVNYISVNSEGQTEYEVKTKVEVCEIMPALAGEVFRIDPSPAVKIWDNDAKVFTRGAPRNIQTKGINWTTSLFLAFLFLTIILGLKMFKKMSEN